MSGSNSNLDNAGRRYTSVVSEIFNIEHCCSNYGKTSLFSLSTQFLQNIVSTIAVGLYSTAIVAKCDCCSCTLVD